MRWGEIGLCSCRLLLFGLVGGMPRLVAWSVLVRSGRLEKVGGEWRSLELLDGGGRGVYSRRNVVLSRKESE